MDDRSDVEKASRTFLLYVLLPLWLIPGIADYLCHKRSDIEHTSGTHESLTHMLMITSTGAGITMGLLFEIDAGVIATMTALALVHEAIVVWDVGYANARRPPSSFEQHVHSFLEVLPFTGLAFTMCLHPQAVVRLIRGTAKPRLRLTWKRKPESPWYIAAIAGAATVALFIPYLEEFVRCYRVDGTIMPRRP